MLSFGDCELFGYNVFHGAVIVLQTKVVFPSGLEYSAVRLQFGGHHLPEPLSAGSRPLSQPEHHPVASQHLQVPSQVQRLPAQEQDSSERVQARLQTGWQVCVCAMRQELGVLLVRRQQLWGATGLFYRQVCRGQEGQVPEEEAEVHKEKKFR